MYAWKKRESEEHWRFAIWVELFEQGLVFNVLHFLRLSHRVETLLARWSWQCHLKHDGSRLLFGAKCLSSTGAASFLRKSAPSRTPAAVLHSFLLLYSRQQCFETIIATYGVKVTVGL